MEEEGVIVTNFVITASSDSPRILNYSKDSKSRLV
jgi:hypothetical protein